MKKTTKINKAFTVVKKYFSAFAVTFISVILAFVLTEWSSNKNEKLSETKLLTEIDNGIQIDLKDFEANIGGHQSSLRAIALMRNWIDNEPIPQDSIGIYYNVLFRNFTPIINKSGYESLKATNLKVITNDSLRFQIINLYDYYYTIIEKLEDNVAEMQDFSTFYTPTNKIVSQYMTFDKNGKFIELKKATDLTKSQKQELLSYLWKMENNKKFKIFRYHNVIDEIKKLDQHIKNELNK